MGGWFSQLMQLLSNTIFILIALMVLAVILAVGSIPVIGKWKVYSKAGFPGWAIFVPYYSDYVYVRIAGFPTWAYFVRLGIHLLIPKSDFFMKLILSIFVARGFNRSVPFGIGLGILDPIFLAILGLGNSQYHQPDAFAEIKAKLPGRKGPQSLAPVPAITPLVDKEE
jgi:hypothetical protein